VQIAKAKKIPLHKPYVHERAFEEIRDVLKREKLSGDGEICRKVERTLCSLFSVKRTLLTTSCTHALEMAMMMLDLRPGDEVITPSFTFVSTANAILRGGGTPVFCDINPRTCTIDPEDIKRKITPNTKAIIPVHYAGVSAEMDEILDLAKRNNLMVVEDAAQGVNAKYKEKFLGGIGDIGAYSFHDTKNYVSGEGGALVTNNEELARRAEIIREKGTNRENFLRGEVDKYTWVDIGSSYILSEILAALLRSQLNDIDIIQSKRRDVHMWYMDGFSALASKERIRLPIIPDYCESNYHIFYILLQDEHERDMVMKHLKNRGVGAAFHYVPLHSSPFAKKHLRTNGLNLPSTDDIAGRILRLPMYPDVTSEDVNYVVECVAESLP
jgi:dTDP-4-amino-4,6-dideoxygalactose transaminase